MIDFALLAGLSLDDLADPSTAAVSEFYDGLADEVAYQALPEHTRRVSDIEGAWRDYSARWEQDYIWAQMDAHFGRSMKLAHNMTLDMCAGKLSKNSQRWLKRLNMALDTRRATFRHQISPLLNAIGIALVIAALAQSIEAPAVALVEAA